MQPLSHIYTGALQPSPAREANSNTSHHLYSSGRCQRGLQSRDLLSSTPTTTFTSAATALLMFSITTATTGRNVVRELQVSSRLCDVYVCALVEGANAADELDGVKFRTRTLAPMAARALTFCATNGASICGFSYRLSNMEDAMTDTEDRATTKAIGKACHVCPDMSACTAMFCVCECVSICNFLCLRVCIYMVMRGCGWYWCR